MKKCEYIRELLSLYLDNELHENKRKQVVQHLEECNECKQELEALKNIVDSLDNLDDIDLPDDYNESLHIKLVEASKELQKNKWKRRTKYISFASTAVAGLLFFVFAIGGSNFTGMMNKIKIAYVNDVDLSVMESLPNEQVASQNSILNDKYDLRDNSLQDSQSEIYNENKALLDDGKEYIADKNISANNDDTSEKTYDVAVKITALDNQEPEENSEIMGIMSFDVPNTETHPEDSASNDTPLIKEESVETLAKTADKEVNVGVYVDDSSAVCSKVISTVQSIGGSIEEIALLGSIKNSSSEFERRFKISISSSEFEKLISLLKQDGVISVNTFSGADTSENITVTLRIIQKEFLRNR